MKLLKEWRQRQAEEFRVWIAEHLFKNHIEPLLKHVTHVVDHNADQVEIAWKKADEANERSAELGKMISELQSKLRGQNNATLFLAERGDKMEARIAALED
ncbi:MAG: hypothetical protein GY906_27875 [bacterium]|nr:hypothetical protein [bacterium]